MRTDLTSSSIQRGPTRSGRPVRRVRGCASVKLPWSRLWGTKGVVRPF